ncbi:MAG: hypothetical protein Fur0043_18590 [Anaerolineales bacterium]
MNNRLGCLSPLALISAFVALVILAAAEIVAGDSMFSPGTLHTAHADIGKNCAQCHAPFWSSQSMSDRCLTCHDGIQREMADSSTLHGKLVKEPVSTCQACHTEHGGPNAALTVMDMSSFPHEVTGFALTAHRVRSAGIPFTCNDCHIEKLSRFNEQTCTECHRQIDMAFTVAHTLSFGENCLACHDGHDRFSDFDHNRTAFALTGKHLSIDCSLCHLDARTLADLQGLSPACETCHLKDDAHQGRFGTNCGVCHSPDGWETAQFDHNLAAFKLEGKHTQVACEQCHLNNQFKGTPQDCYSCHKANDKHNGQFGTACEACHTPSSWENATFDHNLAAFKLEGKHVNVACEKCHINGQFKGTPQDCYSCHKTDDEHNGQFGTACESCHNPSSWEGATFDHSRSNFPLTGAHSNVRCEQCHVNRQFAGTPTQCVACHGDPAWHAGAMGTDCAACHSTSAWQPARFDLSHPEPRVHEHGTGVNHGSTTCQTCHPNTVYTYTCLACHSDNQGGEGGEGGDD